MKPQALQALLRHPGIWRGAATPSLTDQRTGFAELDRQLPGRGWPRGALIELIPSRLGIGELQLLLPSLRAQSQSWVAPPHIPYAPALAAAGINLAELLIVRPRNPADSLWAMEQILRSGVASHVLGWHDTMQTSALRRLQLAAEAGACRLFLFRPAHCVKQPSPAPLRLYLEPAENGLYLRLVKCRGGRPGAMILPLSDAHAVALHSSPAPASRRPASRAA